MYLVTFLLALGFVERRDRQGHFGSHNSVIREERAKGAVSFTVGDTVLPLGPHKNVVQLVIGVMRGSPCPNFTWALLEKGICCH